MRVRPLAPLALALAVGLAPATARADEALRFDLERDVTVTILAGAGWIATELGKPGLAPATCRWCDATPNGLDDGVRRALVWSRPETAGKLSDVAVFGLAPLSAIGLGALAAWYDRRAANIPADAVIVLESALLAMDLNQATKYLAGRARPYVRFHNEAVLVHGPDPNDGNLSFFSGHTTAAFSLAVASGTVASMRRYRLAPWVWAQGLGLALAAGYLRIAADRHYFTDVLTGAVIGAAAGVTVPLLHRARSGGGASISFGPVAGPGLGVVGLW